MTSMFRNVKVIGELKRTVLWSDGDWTGGKKCYMRKWTSLLLKDVNHKEEQRNVVAAEKDLLLKE